MIPSCKMKLPHNHYTEVYHELLPSYPFERGHQEALKKPGWPTRKIAKGLTILLLQGN
jgi:hypothetical protein